MKSNVPDPVARTFNRFALFCAILGVIAGFGLGLLASLGTDTNPSCPTEDSCSVSYDNNRWNIREDTP